MAVDCPSFGASRADGGEIASLTRADLRFRAFTACKSKRPRPKLGGARFSQHSALICPNAHFKGWGSPSKSVQPSADRTLVGFPPEIASLRQSYSNAASSAQEFSLEAGRFWQDTMPP